MQFPLRLSLLLLGILISILSNFFFVEERTQLVFMIIAFIALGVPHGALDIYVEAGLDEKKDNRKIFIRYVIQAGLYIFLWFWQPAIALCIFILITAFHFGEIDWIGHANDRLKKTTYFILGLCWIIFLLSLHVKTALDIFDSITRNRINPEEFLRWANFLYPVSIAGMILIYGFLFFKRSSYFLFPQYWLVALVQQALLLVLAHVTPLWIFFAFYFGVWHSILSLDKIRAHLKLGTNWKDWIFLLKKAMPFSVMAWIGILYFIFLTVKSTDTAGMLSLVFIGLAVLTVPHLQVFTKLNKPPS
jgi:Brp/Blh family beta-carotene 15,15'-monooxygenase